MLLPGAKDRSHIIGVSRGTDRSVSREGIIHPEDHSDCSFFASKIFNGEILTGSFAQVAQSLWMCLDESACRTCHGIVQFCAGCE